jgi:hypothetical protein
MKTFFLALALVLAAVPAVSQNAAADDRPHCLTADCSA